MEIPYATWTGSEWATCPCGETVAEISVARNMYGVLVTAGATISCPACGGALVSIQDARFSKALSAASALGARKAKGGVRLALLWSLRPEEYGDLLAVKAVSKALDR